MELATIDPHGQKEHTEIHKIPKFGVNQASFKINKEMYGVRTLVQTASGWPYISLFIIIHQTHYEKSDWSRAFNQFTIACELHMINAISAADIAFIMSSSTSAWFLLRHKMAEPSLPFLRMNYVKNV